MKQHEAVVQALEELGGYATLNQIYHKALSYPQVRWGTKTPQASIRRILQQRPEFFKIHPGLWGLSALEQDIRRHLQIDTQSTPEQREDFDHAYYQGIIAEWGQLLGYSTYIPPQDRSKTFLNRLLRDVIMMDEIPSFTYPQLVQQAKQADVIWFSTISNHLFPVKMFEVEHTTNFDRAIERFENFLYFDMDFFVVADESKRKGFEHKIGREAPDLRKRVKFLSYDALVKVYTKEAERLQAYREAGIEIR